MKSNACRKRERIKRRERKSESLCKQWPAILPNATMGDAQGGKVNFYSILARLKLKLCLAINDQMELILTAH